MVYGFLGPNGAGKTTTMRALTGLVHADGGTVEILGKPMELGDRHRLFEVGALVESPTSHPYLSARANLRELTASGAHVPSRRIEELLDRGRNLGSGRWLDRTRPRSARDGHGWLHRIPSHARA
jgi:ABC-2 type transport system ATP-binding protein